MSDLELIEAVKADNIGRIKELIASGGDINQQDEYGWTPLNWAAGKGRLEIVKLLVGNGADIFKVGRDQRTPYLIALAAGRVEAVKYLREVENNFSGEKPARPERKYCKAYNLEHIRQFPGWSESRINWKTKDNANADENSEEPHSFSGEDIVFVHQDYTVTESMWHNENVIFNHVTPEWKDFCADKLSFKVPDDLDLVIEAANVSDATP